MPVTQRTTRKSSRLGRRNYKVPPPLRFKSLEDAKKHIRANKLKVTGHVGHSRRATINVVDPTGKARTISIERQEEE